MFKNLRNLLEISNKNPKILHKKPKFSKISLNPKHLLKQFLRWLKLRDVSGELLIKEDTDINQILDYWTKGIILWLMGIIVTGFIVTVAILPFHTPRFGFEIFIYIFSFGLLWWVALEAIKDIRNAIKKGV